MENNNELFYYNRYGKYSNDVLNKQAANCFDYVLRNNEYNINKYLSDLSNNYENANCYMYVLQTVVNYLVGLYDVTLDNYKYSRDVANKETLDRLKSKYDEIMKVYYYQQKKLLTKESEKRRKQERNNQEINNRGNNDNIINYDFAKKNKFGIKRKIYINDLKNRAR